ncbi:hypothetical protein A5669_21920 [Mycolicibacterium fortuitum]|nr:hypothetical protein A5669_21920 [Mycolicibacterium fortuitum]
MPCVDIQAVGDLDDGFQSQAALTTFHFSELGPVDPATYGRCFLAEAEFDPACAHTLTEGLRRRVQR